MEDGERAKAKSEDKTGEKGGEKTGEKSWEKIVREIANNSEITTVELSKIVGLSTTAVENNLKKLKDQGKIQCVGPDKGGYWKVL